MSNLLDRLERLAESVKKDSTKKIIDECVSMAFHVKEDQLSKIVVERLENLLKETGKYREESIVDFLNVERKLNRFKNLGVREALVAIRESVIQTHPQVDYKIREYLTWLDNKYPEYLLVDHFLSNFNEYSWDFTVLEQLTKVRDRRKKYAEEILVAKTISELEKHSNFEFYKPLVEKLEYYLEKGYGNDDRKMLIRELKSFQHLSNVENLVTEMSRSVNEKSLLLKTDNKNSRILYPYSFVHVTERGNIFRVSNNYYIKTYNDKILRLNENDCRIIPQEIGIINEWLNSEFFAVRDDRLYIQPSMDYLVEMFFDDDNNKSKKIIVNSQEIGIDEALNILSRAKMMDRYWNVPMNIFGMVWENLELLKEIDVAKIIESKSVSGSRLTLFKTSTGFCASRELPAMSINEFYPQLTSIQVKTLARETMSYDISESLPEFVDKNDRKLAAIREKKQMIVESIYEIDRDIEKLDSVLNTYWGTNVTEENVTLIEEREEIISKKSSLEKEYERLSVEEGAMVSIIESDIEEDDDIEDDSESDEEVEKKKQKNELSLNDKVTVSNYGTGVIVSIDDPNKLALVLFDSGEKKIVPFGTIKNVEDNIEDRYEENDEHNNNDDDEIEESLFTKRYRKFNKSRFLREKATTPHGSVINGMNTSVNNSIDTDPVEVVPKVVSARVAINFPGYIRGEIVDITDAERYTSSGPDDNIPIKTVTGVSYEIPKRWLEIREGYTFSVTPTTANTFLPDTEIGYIDDENDDGMEYHNDPEVLSEYDILHDILSHLEGSIADLKSAEEKMSNLRLINTSTFSECMNSLLTFVESIRKELDIAAKSDGTNV